MMLGLYLASAMMLGLYLASIIDLSEQSTEDLNEQLSGDELYEQLPGQFRLPEQL